MNAKSIISVIVAGIVVSMSSLAADAPPPKLTMVEQRMWEIDLNVLLKQYEKLRTALVDMRFERELENAEEGALTEKEQKLRDAKENVIRKALDMLQNQLREMSDKEAERAKDKKEK